MRRSVARLAALLLLPAALAAPASPARADTGPPEHRPGVSDRPWRGEPTLIGGTSRYDRGEWIHTDFVYDDYGADTGTWGQPNAVSLAPASGDARYPVGPEFADNAADIVEVRVRARQRDLEVRVLLQTILDPSVVALWVQLDEREPVVITEHGADIDVDANTVAFTLPRALDTGSEVVTLNVGAGLHDGAGGLRAGVAGNRQLSPGELTTGGPTANRLLDLAFNTREVEGRGGAWNEDVQSAALATGVLAPFAQEIVLAELRDTTRRPVEPLEPGYHVRLFESRQDLGEGVAESFPQFRGRWQPYALWIPDGHDPGEPAPLLLSLHSLSVHHNQYRGGSSPTYRTYYEQLGDGLGAIVVTPLGRGPDGWYLDEAFVDTLEVWADASRHHRIDPERVRITGYSMGGYGTYRFATLLPDSFASAASVVGPPTNGIWAYPLPASGPFFTHDQLESTRHVPFWITHGVLDELVPVLGVRQQANRLAELGHEHRFALHPAEDHLTFTVKDDWSREAAWLDTHDRRVTDPSRVTLRIRPSSLLRPARTHLAPLVHDLLAEVGARVDGAYWVGGVVPAEGDDVTAAIDLHSGGVARQEAGTEDVRELGLDGPSPHLLTGTSVQWTEAERDDVLHGSLSGVEALRVDIDRAGLTKGARIEVTTDRPVRLDLVRGRRVVASHVLTPAG